MASIPVTSVCNPESLQAQADAELARRGPAGMLVFACLVPLLLASMEFFRVHRGAMLTAVAITYGAIGVRSWLIWRGGGLYVARRPVWMAAKFATVVAPTVMWDAFYCVLAVRYGSDSWDVLLLLLCMVCTCFGALHTFTPNLAFMWAYPCTLLAGPVIVNAWLETPHHWMITAGVGVLLIFITMQGKVLHTQYWRGLEDQDSLRKAIQQAESASEAKGAFLANMSHEIRTPLNGVLGMIAVTLESELTGEQREQLEAARESGLLLQAILNDVLDLSKIEAGKVVLEATEFDLEMALSHAVRMVTPGARQRGLEIALEYPGKMPKWFRGDEGKLRQIILNYLENALKFTASGGVTVQVEAGARSDHGTEITIAVRDTGIGLTPEQQSRLFEKFSQADASTTRKYGGTGLGLVICKRLAEVMGGTVGVTSAEGAGSTFRVTIPLTPVERPAAAGSARAGDLITRRHGRVLVVDDNAINQKIMRQLLGRRGLTVEVAGNGNDAVEMTLAAEYSIVFMDCQMPELDGYEATRRIRSGEREPARRRTPVVAMTANAMPGDRERCLAAGMDDYLSKPVAVEELERVLSCWSLEAAAAGAARAQP